MSTPKPVEPPHVEIEVAGEAVIQLYKKQQRYLRSKDAAYLTDLLEGCKDVASHEDFSIRVGAEVNRAAALMVIEERSKQ